MKRLKSKVQFYEDCLEMPAASWAFNCHLVATRAIENGCLDARAQYGFYTGPVSDKCEFDVWKRQYAQKVPIRHGWAVSEDGVITDLTRWVFEGKVPYIAVIYPTDKEYGEYDQGMAKFKERLAKPCPARDDPRPNYSRPAPAFQSGELEPWIMEMTGDTQGHPFTMGQIIWLANLGPQHLGDRGRDLYRALEAAGLRAFVPTDYWDEVMRRNPNYRKNTDESIRRLERSAKQGDIQACTFCQEFKKGFRKNPDAQDRELERKAMQGDLEAALGLYYARLRKGLLPTLPALRTKDRFTVENPPSSDADRLATTRYGIFHLHERLAKQKAQLNWDEQLMARLIVDELRHQQHDVWENPFWDLREPTPEWPS